MRLRPLTVAETVDGVPAVLVDPDAAVWWDRDRWIDYAEQHRVPLPIRDRFRGPDGFRQSSKVAADERRRAAVLQWALEAGITTTYGASSTPLADGPRLDAMGLL